MIYLPLRILFILRKRHSANDNLTTIYIRVTINGKITEFTSGIKIDPSLWDQRSQRLIGNTKVILEINENLFQITDRLRQKYKEIAEIDGIPSPIRLKNAFWGLDNVKIKYLLLGIFDKLITQKRELATSQVIKMDSVESYVVSKGKLTRYLEEVYHNTDLDIRKIDYDFIEGFKIFLLSRGKCKHNTMIRHLRHLKQVTTYSYKNGYLIKDPFYSIRLSVKKVDRIYLQEEELKKIIELKFIDKTLEEVRDVFIFCCFSGLSYIDIKQLRYRDISGNSITIHRQKTGNKSFIPILSISQLLIDKYTRHSKPDDYIFPVYGSQRMNALLKIIGDLAGINKPLSSHVGRHSFATLMLSKGISVESIAKMLGHTELKTTMIYAKILEEKVIGEVNRVEDLLMDLTDTLKKQLVKKV